MKKLITLTILLTIGLIAFAGSGKVAPKATNYKQVLSEIEYPEESKLQGIEGRVIVLLKIDKHGNIKNYQFVSYPSIDLKDAVKKALVRMTFEPAIDEKGKAVSGKIALPIDFKLTI